MPLLLRQLELKGALNTLNAMGTQRAIAQAVADGGGDYVPALRDNWSATRDEIGKIFADRPPKLVPDRCETIDGSHGGIETCRHTMCHDTDRLFSNRHCPGKFRFPGQAAVGMIESETERAGIVKKWRRQCYLCASKIDAETLTRAVRRHWGIEYCFHLGPEPEQSNRNKRIGTRLRKQ